MIINLIKNIPLWACYWDLGDGSCKGDKPSSSLCNTVRFIPRWRNSFYLPGSILLFNCLCACATNVDNTILHTLTISTASGEGIIFNIEVAKNERSRRRGLMYRRSLPLDQGMLLDFNRPTKVSIWMKNTHIPLDLIFIDAKGVIIKIVSNTEPLSAKLIQSDALIRAVLEINANQASAHNINVGDQIMFDIFIS